MRMITRVVAVVLAAIIGLAVPAHAAKAKGTTLAPTSFTTEHSCSGISVAICHRTDSPGTDSDPTMAADISVTDAVDPAPITGGAVLTVTHKQAATQTITKSVQQLTLTWSFTVTQAFSGESTGAGTKNWTADLSVMPFLDDCPSFPYIGQQLVHLTTGNTVAAGTTYKASFTFGPCPGMNTIPAGTHASLTATLFHTASAGDDGQPWSGHVAMHGAVKTTSITSTAL